VLDTWFSSALWPFSTLGWPDDTADLRTYYPTSVLVTAFDILFFWVARMIMMGLRFMDDVPFRDVYIHAIVRDEGGQKMSKSKGNVVDPLLLIDKYGADAFRFTLAAFAAQGRDVKFSEDRVQGYRHFINKLWNATRFILMNLDDAYKAPAARELREDMQSRVAGKSESLASRWILSRLAYTVGEVNSALEEYRFNDASSAVYQFTWHEFCDWYIEMSKTEVGDPGLAEIVRYCLLYTLETVLRLLHPFMPFLTEEIWQSLPLEKRRESISISRFPEDLPREMGAEEEMGFVMDAVTGIRNIRGELNLPPAQELDVLVRTASEAAMLSIANNLHYVSKLARAQVHRVGMDVSKPEKSYTSVKEQLEVYVMLESLDVSSEVKRLNKEIEKLNESIGYLNKKLQNPDFLDRAPGHIIEKERKRYEEFIKKHQKVAESIDRISGLGGF
jgi:valyl-tRNA synthetase